MEKYKETKDSHYFIILITKIQCYINLLILNYEKIINNAEKTMMKRYHDEYHHGQFGIYQGNEKKGKVKKVY